MQYVVFSRVHVTFSCLYGVRSMYIDTDWTFFSFVFLIALLMIVKINHID